MSTDRPRCSAALFIDGAVAADRRRAAADHQPRRPARSFGRGRRAADAGDVDARRARRPRGVRPSGRALGFSKARRDPGRRRRGAARAHLDELVPMLVARAGQDASATRSIEMPKAVDTLMHYVGLSKALRGAHMHEPRPRRRRPRAAAPARRRRRDRAVELPDDAAVQQARARRSCAGNTVVAKPAGTTPLTTLRLAELLTEARPAARACSTSSRAPGPIAGAALVTHPRRPQDRLHRLDAGRRADHGARRARDASG